MKAFVICLNDSVEFVVLHFEKKAKIKMEELAEKYWDRNKGNIVDQFVEDYIDYRNRYYWHIHEVEAE